MVSSLPPVGPNRQRDRGRWHFPLSCIAMLYMISMLALLTVSPGFLIGRSVPAAAESTETKAIRRSQHLLDERASSFRRPPEIKEATQKFLNVRGSLRQTRASVHTYGRREEATSKYRRSLQAGPGSSLPSCTGKCGVCSPCKPVHVAIGSPHEVISETEYYPEVWRCQCGNQLFIP